MVEITLDLRVYPLEAVLNACYAFIEKVYIFCDLEKKDDKKLNVTFKPKKRSAKALSKLHGEFMNELLYCVLRQKVSKKNKKIREYIVGKALFAADPASTFDLLEEDDDFDYREDPLDIAIPWEEKYGKDKKKKSKV